MVPEPSLKVQEDRQAGAAGQRRPDNIADQQRGRGERRQPPVQHPVAHGPDEPDEQRAREPVRLGGAQRKRGNPSAATGAADERRLLHRLADERRGDGDGWERDGSERPLLGRERPAQNREHSQPVVFEGEPPPDDAVAHRQKQDRSAHLGAAREREPPAAAARFGEQQLQLQLARPAHDASGRSGGSGQPARSDADGDRGAADQDGDVPVADGQQRQPLQPRAARQRRRGHVRHVYDVTAADIRGPPPSPPSQPDELLPVGGQPDDAHVLIAAVHEPLHELHGGRQPALVGRKFLPDSERAVGRFHGHRGVQRLTRERRKVPEVSLCGGAGSKKKILRHEQRMVF